MWRFVTFRPRTAEVPLRDPMEEAQHQRDMEAQYREFMGREMAVFMSQRQLAAVNCPDQLVLPEGQFPRWARSRRFVLRLRGFWVLPETGSAPRGRD